MARVVSTYGTGEKFVTSALMGLGATQQDPNGRFYVDGNMVNAELSQAIVECIYVGEIFREGQSITSKYTTDRQAGAVRVMMDTPFPPSSRSVSFGGRRGTKGNGGVINVNPPYMPTNEEIMIYLNQVNDQSMLFPDMAKEYIPLDVMAKKIASYAGSVQQDRDASTLAEVLGYSIFRSLNDGQNIIQFTEGDGAYANLLATLNAKFANGDPVTGAYSYKAQGRTIIGRPSFIYNIFKSKSGIILNGNDLAQRMLKEYNLDAGFGEKSYVGESYVGNFGTIDFQVANDNIWKRAEQYLELSEGALDHVLAVAVYADGLAGAKVIDLGVKMVDMNNNKRGVEMQPLNMWGHEAIRKHYIIGDNTLSNNSFTTMGFSADVRVYPVAPEMAKPASEQGIQVPVYGLDGSIIGYRTIASTPTPNGGNIASGLDTVAAPSASVAPGTYATTQSVALSSATTGATIYYTTNGNTPTTASSVYSSAISVSATTTIKAIAFKAGMITSEVKTFAYTIGN
jgi:hypothetical protein